MAGVTTVTPQAIDAFVFIESIRIVDRHRKELGELQGLMKSIEDVGLLHPPTITEDSRLVAGQRRIEACRQLGWDSVPVRIAKNLDEAARLLRAERDENTCRKDMLLSEKASLGEALHTIATRAAEQRQREHGGTAPGRPSNTSGGPAGSVSNTGEARELVGEALDMSPRTYTDLRYVYRTAKGLHDEDESPPAEDLQSFAQSCLDEMDRTGSIQPNANKVRAKVRARRDAGEAKAAALADPKPEQSDELAPGRSNRSPLSAIERFNRIRELAAAGHTSSQIAKTLGYAGANSVRQTAKEQDIDIPADAVMGKSRKTIDSNRIIRETVQSLEGLEMGLNLVDFDELDPAEIGDWTASLSESIRRLNRLNKRLKEKAQ